MTTNTPFCIGHRGAKGYTPENTLPSFEQAIQLGCPWVELDVHLIEGELIVIHDEQVDRTTNGTGRLSDLTLSYIRSLDAGGGARIPTLSEVIDCVNHRCRINIELKGKGTAAPTGKLLARYCAGDWVPADFLISSFNHRELARMDKPYPRGALFTNIPDDIWAQVAALNAWSVNFAHWNLSQALVEQAHERGYKVLVYTVNELQDIERVIGYGVDGVFSDFPDRVLAACRHRRPE